MIKTLIRLFLLEALLVTQTTIPVMGEIVVMSSRNRMLDQGIPPPLLYWRVNPWISAAKIVRERPEKGLASDIIYIDPDRAFPVPPNGPVWTEETIRQRLRALHIRIDDEVVHFFSNLQVRPNSRLLVIGCGRDTNRLGRYAASLGLHFVGMDWDEPEIRQARQQWVLDAHFYKLPGTVEYLVANIEYTQVALSSFDAVYLENVLDAPHLKYGQGVDVLDKHKTLMIQTALRAVKNGGSMRVGLYVDEGWNKTRQFLYGCAKQSGIALQEVPEPLPTIADSTTYGFLVRKPLLEQWLTGGWQAAKTRLRNAIIEWKKKLSRFRGAPPALELPVPSYANVRLSYEDGLELLSRVLDFKGEVLLSFSEEESNDQATIPTKSMRVKKDRRGRILSFVPGEGKTWTMLARATEDDCFSIDDHMLHLIRYASNGSSRNLGRLYRMTQSLPLVPLEDFTSYAPTAMHRLRRQMDHRAYSHAEKAWQIPLGSKDEEHLNEFLRILEQNDPYGWILNAGSGSGLHTDWLHRHSTTHRIVAGDISIGMLLQAKQRVQNLVGVCTNLMMPGFKKQSISGIWDFMGTSLAPRELWVLVFATYRWILREGGILYWTSEQLSPENEKDFLEHLQNTQFKVLRYARASFVDQYGLVQDRFCVIAQAPKRAA